MTNEVRTTSSTGGMKGVKPERYDLIPIEALDIMARLYGFGAEKYDAHNWRKGYEWSKSFASLMRHATSFWRGEDIDEETGLPHLAGAAFHCFTLMVFMEEQPDFDDRFKKQITTVAETLSNDIRSQVVEKRTLEDDYPREYVERMERSLTDACLHLSEFERKMKDGFDVVDIDLFLATLKRDFGLSK